MILSRQAGRTICLSLLLFVLSGTAEYPSGLEITKVTFCGKYDKPPTIKASPWPFIPIGNLFNVSLTFTPAVDVLEASIQYKVVSDGEVVLEDSYDKLCKLSPDLCSLPADETKVWTRSGKLPVIPPVLKNRTYKVSAQLFNEEKIVFLCAEVVAKLH